MRTEHFSFGELHCPCAACGRACRLDSFFLSSLEELRAVFGRPMPVSSGYRCPTYNDRVSSTGIRGPHTVGAVDVVVAHQDAFDLVASALRLQWTGVGVHQRGKPHAGRFIHLDRLPPGAYPRPRVWSY
jgi:uncharacterized protein YcbK (DUF882 family)